MLSSKSKYSFLNMADDDSESPNDKPETLFTGPDGADNFRTEDDFKNFINWCYNVGEENEKPPPCESKQQSSKYSFLNMADDDSESPNDKPETLFTGPDGADNFRTEDDFKNFINWCYNVGEENEKPPPCGIEEPPKVAPVNIDTNKGKVLKLTENVYKKPENPRKEEDIIKITGDGNCLFYSFIYMATADEDIANKAKIIPDAHPDALEIAKQLREEVAHFYNKEENWKEICYNFPNADYKTAKDTHKELNQFFGFNENGDKEKFFFDTETKPCENEFKQEYISRLKQRKNFGGYVELIALANLYGVNIHIFDLSQQETENEDFQTIVTPFGKDKKYQKLNIYINYENKIHYQAYDRDKFKEDSLKKKQPTEDEAAVVMQRVARGRKARRARSREQKHKQEIQHAEIDAERARAAQVVQRIARGRKARHELQAQRREQNDKLETQQAEIDFSKPIGKLESEGIILDIKTDKPEIEDMDKSSMLIRKEEMDKALMLIREAYFKNHKTNKEKNNIPKGKMLNKFYTFNALENLKKMIVENEQGNLEITDIRDSEFKIIDYDYKGSLENSTIFLGGKLLGASYRKNITTTWMEILMHARSSHYITEKQYFESVEQELTPQQKAKAKKAWKSTQKLAIDVEREKRKNYTRKNKMIEKEKANKSLLGEHWLNVGSKKPSSGNELTGEEFETEDKYNELKILFKNTPENNTISLEEKDIKYYNIEKLNLKTTDYIESNGLYFQPVKRPRLVGFSVTTRKYPKRDNLVQKGRYNHKNSTPFMLGANLFEEGQKDPRMEELHEQWKELARQGKLTTADGTKISPHEVPRYQDDAQQRAYKVANREPGYEPEWAEAVAADELEEKKEEAAKLCRKVTGRFAKKKDIVSYIKDPDATMKAWQEEVAVAMVAVKKADAAKARRKAAVVAGVRAVKDATGAVIKRAKMNRKVDVDESDVNVDVSNDPSNTLDEEQSVSEATTRLPTGPLQLSGKSSSSIVLKDPVTGDFFTQASKKKGGGKKTKKTKKIKKNKKIKKIKKSKKQKKNKKNITLNRKKSKYLIK